MKLCLFLSKRWLLPLNAPLGHIWFTLPWKFKQSLTLLCESKLYGEHFVFIYFYIYIFYFFFWGGGGSDPTCPLEAPEALFNVWWTYSLSSLAFKRVTRGRTITNLFVQLKLLSWLDSPYSWRLFSGDF